MKIIVMSDIHANITALDAVLASSRRSDAIWCLGDLVGYGPDANECVERVRALPNLTCLMGNHDAAVSGNKSITSFNDDAGDAILLTRKILTPGNLEYLKSLPATIRTDLAILAHGSPRNPIWEYVIDSFTALSNFAFFDTQLAAVGHTHVPFLFTIDALGERTHRRMLKADTVIQLKERAILNPGSVGQPRDHDPRASYGILDPDAMTWEIKRVEYDIQAVQKRILKKGFPEKQAQRLAEGW